MTSDPFAPEIKRVGWPKGKPRKKPLVSREPVVSREPIHEPIRKQSAPQKGAVDMSQWDDFTYEEVDSVDRLKVPREVIPDGMDYQWITDSVLGQSFATRRAQFERAGWRPVPAERHDGLFMPKGYTGEINIEGVVLMERPLEFSRRAKVREQQNAKGQVIAKENSWKGGDLGVTLDAQHPSAIRQNKIVKSYERVPVPKD